jgi:TrmH family RNA methyltransferase
MRNFGLSDLRLVSPKTTLGDEAYRYATRGREIVERARQARSLGEAIRGVRNVVGTTAKPSTSTRNILRTAITPAQLASRLAGRKGSVALLFGRESSGLTNAELQRCTIVVSIPASEDYRVLNVATAASIVFYELFRETSAARSSLLEPSRQAVDRLASVFAELADKADLPSHRKRLANRAFRNMLARSVISRREVSLMMGVLRKTRDKSAKRSTKRRASR